MDYYYEQNVDNPNIDKHLKRTKTLSVLRYMVLAIGIIFAYLFFFWGTKAKLSAILFSLFFVALEMTPVLLVFFLIGKYLKQTNSEYDYLLNGSILRIVRVIRRNKRKLFLTIRLDSVESIGKINSETYERYAASREIKKQYAVCDYDDEDALVYMYYHGENGNCLLHFEPDEEMILTLRKSLPRFSIMDKSMNAPVISTKKE
ncbi:MAG: hypothetical protein K2M95_04380 [Clostridiales bacterium]|nr:hypothetical protein [Clostridiales bacterium]